jgi:mono/diheme cytochrome c family protein
MTGNNATRRWKGWGTAGLLAAIAVVGSAITARVAFTTDAAREGVPAAAVERGRYLVTAMGCNDCHTPWKPGANGPEPDMSRMLSGHPEQVKVSPLPASSLGNGWEWAGLATNTAYTGPWGISYAANLTPDRNTGIGIWTEDIFVRAIRTGRHWGTSRPIMPPMPWQAFRNLSDQDLQSIFAYLRTIPPVTNHVPDYQPPLTSAATH